MLRTDFDDIEILGSSESNFVFPNRGRYSIFVQATLHLNRIFIVYLAADIARLVSEKSLFDSAQYFLFDALSNMESRKPHFRNFLLFLLPKKILFKQKKYFICME